MAKPDDGPKISLRVEKGRLVALTPYDLELIVDNWHEGAVISVRPVRGMQRVRERQYFAMLGKLLKVADTPWTNVETAHEAIKLATGFVDPYQKKDRSWGVHARSMATFTDGELEEFFALFCGIVQKRFGIDPETLGRESRSSEPAAPQGAVLDDGPGAGPIPSGVGEPPNDDQEWLKMTARMLVSATTQDGGKEEAGVLERQWDAIVQYLTPDGLNQKTIDVGVKIYNHCRKACLGEAKLAKAMIATMAGCTVDDLRPEAR